MGGSRRQIFGVRAPESQEAPAVFPLPMVTGTYYAGTVMAASAPANVAMTANRHYAVPIFIARPTSFDRIGISVTTGTGAGVDRARLGVYKDSNGVPGTLQFDAGEVDVSATATVEITISQTLPVGWYWITIVSNATPSIKMFTATSNAFLPMIGWNGLGMSNKISHYYAALAYTPGVTTLPASFGEVTAAAATNTPLIALRKA